MTPDEGYVVARILHAIFKNRSSCAFTTFSFVVALVLGIMLLRARTPDEHLYPAIGLAVVLFVLLGNGIGALRHRAVEDGSQETGFPVSEPATGQVEEVTTVASPESISKEQHTREATR